jgi:potassium/hydrogen antiporter
MLKIGLSCFRRMESQLYRNVVVIRNCDDPVFLLIFVARPIGVFVSMAFFKQTQWRTKFFVAWVGLRGATPIVFALIPVVMQVSHAMKILNIAFIIVIVSILVQGTTVTWVAKLTGMGKMKFR